MVYVVTREGIYRHEVLLITTNQKQAIDVAETAAEMERQADQEDYTETLDKPYHDFVMWTAEVGTSMTDLQNPRIVVNGRRKG